MGKKKAFDFNEYHAQRIVRAFYGGVEYIAALVRKRYDDFDVEQTGPGEWIGVNTVPVYKMIRDNDENSETFGKRIPEPNTEPTRFKRSYTIPFNADTAKDFKKLQGSRSFNKTELTYLYRDGSFFVPNEEDFWTKSMKDLYAEVVQGKQTVNIEVTNSGKVQKQSAK